jgi:DNA-binding transcriptional LysR family regulator
MSIDTLTLAQLRAVVAVADARSFSHASADLLVAQSSLSRTVAKVERQVKVRLFDRTTRQVVLTPSGAEFVQVARDIVAEFDVGMRHYSGFLAGERGLIRIAALPSLAATLLPAVIHAYRLTHHDVRIELDDMLAAEVLDSVATGAVDLAVTVQDHTAKDLRFRSLLTDQFFCVVPPDHRYAERDRVTWDQLSGESFVAFDESSSVRGLVEDVLATRRIELASRVTARNIASVAGLCSAGLGISAAPELVLPLMEFADVRTIPLVEPTLVRTIGVLTNPARSLTPAARQFIEAIEQATGRPRRAT